MIPIAGFQPFTTIDYPGNLSCVLFAQGCPWRCRYCQNANLWSFGTAESQSDVVVDKWKQLIGYLEGRKGLLDAVVFSGGEVTAHRGLRQAILDVRNLGFKVGLHTAGIYPSRLGEILDVVDWVGFDLKAPLDARYDKITLVKNSAIAVEESLQLVLKSKVDVQFRCTVHPLLLSENDIQDLRDYLYKLSPSALLEIQPFQSQGCQDQELSARH